MPQIVVHRARAMWQDVARNYRVLVDGSERARVGNGASVEISVLPGSHSIRLQVDWCQSPELHITVGEGAPVELECGPNSTPLLALFYVTLLRKKYIWLQRKR